MTVGKPLPLKQWAITVVMVLLVVVIGLTIASAFANPDRLCKDHFSDEWHANESADKPKEALAMCVHENGTTEPLIVENVTSQTDMRLML